MKKLVSLLVSINTVVALFGQNYKSEGDAMAAEKNYPGAAAKYELCMKQDEDCLLKYFKLIYDEKIVAQFSNELNNLIRPLADKGNASAQFYLGYMYSSGKGVPQNYNESVLWYRRSAEQENASAQNNLGFMYQNGYGVPQDYKEAVKYYQLSADQNNAIAQDNLGEMYENGYGVSANRHKAIEWYQKSAAQGNQRAKDNLERLQAAPSTPQITIVNNTGYIIYFVYIKEAASDNWGEDRLESDHVIMNGEPYTLPLQYALNVVNRYDIRLKHLDGDTYEKKNVLVSAYSRIVFTKDDLVSPPPPIDEITFRGGIRLGYNFTRISGKEISTDLKPGFQIGIFWEKFNSYLPELSWANGLLFTTQGCQGSASFLGKTIGERETVKMNLNYLQYQPNLQLKTDGGFANLYARIGLYVGCVLGGKLKVEELGGVSKEEKIIFGAGKDMRRWDFGWSFGAGLQFGDYHVTQLGFDFISGFVNLIPESEHKLTNYGGAVTLTFLFQ